MIKNTTKILFTRTLSEQELEYGKQLGLKITTAPFISIDVLSISEKQLQKFSKKNIAWIFTSKNAVKAIKLAFKRINSEDIPNKIYAVGEKTAEALKDINITPIVPYLHNAKGLIQLLSTNKQQQYVYFTGNLHRNTIPNFMHHNKLNYIEFICYKTTLIQPNIDINNYNIICFSSPSAVDSFCQKYQLENKKNIAIGNTTASKLKHYTNNIVIAKEANIYSMLTQCHQLINNNI